MNTELLTTANFRNTFYDLLSETKSSISIISPFIGKQTALELSKVIKEKNIKCRIITRFYREDFIQQVSSIEGLKYLVEAGAEILALVGLHTKLYVFDNKTSIIGSANFTTGGFYTNHELSILIRDNEPVNKESNNHFNELWNRIEAFNDVKVTIKWIENEIDAVNKQIEKRKRTQSKKANFIKKGAILTYEPYATDKDTPQDVTPISKIDILEHSLSDGSSWLKFIATGTDRIPGQCKYTSTEKNLKRVYLREMQNSRIKENDVVYITAFSYDQNNIPSPMIVGRAVVSGSLNKDEDRKGKYKCYFEFKQAEYVDTNIRNTINLKNLYKDTDFNKDYKTRSHIEIDKDARLYLDRNLEALFKKYGCKYIE